MASPDTVCVVLNSHRKAWTLVRALALVDRMYMANPDAVCVVLNSHRKAWTLVQALALVHRMYMADPDTVCATHNGEVFRGVVVLGPRLASKGACTYCSTAHGIAYTFLRSETLLE
jgi:hypothetical protein